MATRSLEGFLRRARLFLALVVAYLLLLQGLHFIGELRSLTQLEEETAARAETVTRLIADRIGSDRLRALLHDYRARGTQPELGLLPALLQQHQAVAVEPLTNAGWRIGTSLRVRPRATPNDYPMSFLDEDVIERLATGRLVLDTESGLAVDPAEATVSVFHPVLDADASLLGILHVELDATALAHAQRQLRRNLLVQGGSLLAFLALLVLFIGWMMKPLRLLNVTAHARDGELPADLASEDETGFVIRTYVRMIEQLREKEQELRRLRMLERHRADELQDLNTSIVESMVSGIVVLDLSGRIRSMNDVARELLCIADRAVGAHVDQVLRDLPELNTKLAACLRDGQVINRAELRLSLPAVGRRDLGLTVSPLRDREDTRTGALCLLVDLTEVKQLHEQVRLKESLAELGELSAGIAHEFRNALATILGFAKLIERVTDDEPRENAAAIANEVGMLRRVVDDFLRFANPTRLVLDGIELGDLLAETADESRDQSSDREVVVVEDGPAPRITGDETLLRRVFSNLVRNALDAVGSEGRVELRVAPHPSKVAIHVDDDGPGIPEDQRGRVFTPFVTGKSHGTGLGLALARKVVLHHGGTIEAGESPLGGARITVTLPLRSERDTDT